MSHNNQRKDQYQELSRWEIDQIALNIMTNVDRRYYDMRHPYWRQELEEYMNNRGLKKEKPSHS